MGLRPTKGNEDAADRSRGINNLHRVFNGAFVRNSQTTAGKNANCGTGILACVWSLDILHF